jgi:hypothetical protein
MTAITIPNTFIPSTTISSTEMNANFTAVASAIEDSMAIDGSDVMTGPLLLPAGSASAPALAFGTDTNTGLFRHGADDLGFATGGSERAHIDSSGRFILNSAGAVAGASSITPFLQVISTSADASAALLARFSADANAPDLQLAKSRNAGTGGQTVVQSGDVLGQITFAGSDGTNFEAGAIIRAEVSGTPGANDLPTRLAFLVSADGSVTPTERASIEPGGNFEVVGARIGVTSADAGSAPGPYMVMDRQSASPAAFDGIGSLLYKGRDSGGNATDYAYVNANIIDPTNGSEDSELVLGAVVGGALANRVAIADGAQIGSPSGGYKGNGTLNAASGVYDNNVRLGVQAGTVVSLNGLSETTFSGLPAGLNRITIMFAGISFSGSADLLVRIGDSGGVETTGYVAGSAFNGAVAGATDGYNVEIGSAGRTFYGTMTLTRISGNAWTETHILYDNTGGNMSVGSGSKDLSATLDRVQIRDSLGTNTFDAGTVNILYE